MEKKKKIREQIENIYLLIEEFIEEEEDAQDYSVDGIRIVTKMQIKDINSVIQDLFKDNNDFKGVQLENDIIVKLSLIRCFCSETKKMFEEWSKNVKEGEDVKEGRYLQQFFTRLGERKRLEAKHIRLLA